MQLYSKGIELISTLNIEADSVKDIDVCEREKTLRHRPIFTQMF